MKNWIPDQKVWSGGLAGVIGFLVCKGLVLAGISVDPDTVTELVGALVVVTGFLVPPSAGDLISKADQTLKAVADSDHPLAGIVGAVLQNVDPNAPAAQIQAVQQAIGAAVVLAGGRSGNV